MMSIAWYNVVDLTGKKKKLAEQFHYAQGCKAPL